MPLRSNSADRLTNKLADARQKYIATRNAVIDSATERRTAIQEVQRDLAQEDAQLAGVIDAARQ